MFMISQAQSLETSSVARVGPVAELGEALVVAVVCLRRLGQVELCQVMGCSPKAMVVSILNGRVMSYDLG